MKRSLVIIAILAALSSLGLAILQSRNRIHAFVTPTRTYATLEKAIKEGVVRQGWLPDFLPISAYNIREKHNYEQNTVVASFSFDPSQSMVRMLSEGKELPAGSTNGIRPSVVGRREAWFPDAIIQGKFGDLTPAGFRLYRIERRKRVGPYEVTATWHLAVNQKAGVCYLWFFEKSQGQ
jgi:hypothetical protein